MLRYYQILLQYITKNLSLFRLEKNHLGPKKSLSLNLKITMAKSNNQAIKTVFTIYLTPELYNVTFAFLPSNLPDMTV